MTSSALFWALLIQSIWTKTTPLLKPYPVAHPNLYPSISVSHSSFSLTSFSLHPMLMAQPPLGTLNRLSVVASNFAANICPFTAVRAGILTPLISTYIAMSTTMPGTMCIPPSLPPYLPPLSGVVSILEQHGLPCIMLVWHSTATYQPNG